MQLRWRWFKARITADCSKLTEVALCFLRAFLVAPTFIVSIAIQWIVGGGKKSLHRKMNGNFFPWKQLNNYFWVVSNKCIFGPFITVVKGKFKCYWRRFTQCTALPEHFWHRAQWHKHIRTHLMVSVWITLPAQLFISVRVHRVTGRSLYSPHQKNLKQAHLIYRPLPWSFCAICCHLCYKYYGVLKIYQRLKFHQTCSNKCLKPFRNWNCPL